MICPNESDYIIFLEGKSPIFLLSKAVITAPTILGSSQITANQKSECPIIFSDVTAKIENS